MLPAPVLISGVGQNSHSFEPNATAVTARRIIYSAGIPEMPATSKEGTAFIIPIEALSQEEVQEPWTTVRQDNSIFIQYSNRL